MKICPFVISAGVLITGGTGLNTAEIYLPSSGASCILPQLPDVRRYHTVEQTGLLCGGSFTADTCVQWSSDTGTWEQSLTLDTVRYNHVSWTPDPDIGTHLIGGADYIGGTTSSLIKPDGSQETGLTLKYNTRYVMFGGYLFIL